MTQTGSWILKSLLNLDSICFLYSAGITRYFLKHDEESPQEEVYIYNVAMCRSFCGQEVGAENT